MNKALGLVKKNYIIFSLICVVILGLILRFKGLTFNSYWLDELHSADFSDPSRSFISMLKITLEDVHPPLYQTLLWMSYNVFGYSEYTGRCLSAIVGTLSIVFIYIFGKELFNRHVGLYAAFLTSINIFLIQYSQETRSYTLFFLFTIVSYMYLYRVLNTPTKMNIILYWITTVLLLYTHYFAFFIVATQLIVVIVFCIKYSDNKKHLLILSISTSVIFTIAILPLISYLLSVPNDVLSRLEQPPFYFFINYIIAYFGSKLLTLFIFLSLLVSLIYFITKKISKKEQFSFVLLLMWLIAGFLLPYLKSILSSPLLEVRYMIVMIPPIIIISSYGLWRMSTLTRYIVLFVFVGYTFKLLFFNYYPSVQKDQYREVLMDVNKYSMVPIYERIPWNGHHGNNTNHYQTYAKMLKLDTIIQNDSKLRQDMKNDKLPECFWVLDAGFKTKLFPSNNIIEKLKVNQNPSLSVVKEINYLRAEGVLLSYQINPDLCAQKLSF